jgi:capsular polysaccharide transport system permease protein
LGARLTGSLGLGLSFTLFVLVPTLLAGWYFTFVASDIFVSESRFAVRGAVEKMPGSAAALGPLASFATMNSNQDAFIVSNYLQSQPLVDKLEREQGLRDRFTRTEIDPVARLHENSTAEELKAYWNKMVWPAIDNISGIITLQMKAFSAQDALALSQAAIKASEDLVNEISARKRNDAVSFAMGEVSRAERRLQGARLALQEFRDRVGVLDPVRSAQATSTLVAQLKSERIALENEVATARRSLSENAPSLQVLNARLRAMSDQIQTLENQITSANANDRTSSRVLYQYEGLELEREFAEKFYTISQTALERARITADRQQLYLVTFVPPALAEKALFPKRIADITLVFACSFALWSIASMLAATVKDHYT